jgi:DNA-binding NarL/FixJ family response regulator
MSVSTGRVAVGGGDDPLGLVEMRAVDSSVIPPLPARLTAREAEVLRLLALGLTTQQVAERLVISAKTADHHVQHIYTKIGVSTRGAAALFAIEHGILTADA